MDVRKALWGDRDVKGLQVGVAVGFCEVASCAGPAPAGNVAGEMGPNVSGRNEAAGGSDAGMGEAMNVLEKG